MTDRWTPGEMADLLERCEAAIVAATHYSHYSTPFHDPERCGYCATQRDARALAAALREMEPHDHTWEDRDTETPVYLLPLKGKP